MADVDGDDVRCRWAESSRGECAGVCRVFTGATLTGVRTHFVTWQDVGPIIHTGQIHEILLLLYHSTNPMKEEAVRAHTLLYSLC